MDGARGFSRSPAPNLVDDRGEFELSLPLSDERSGGVAFGKVLVLVCVGTAQVDTNALVRDGSHASATTLLDFHFTAHSVNMWAGGEVPWDSDKFPLFNRGS